jgi:hypothetical protein
MKRSSDGGSKTGAGTIIVVDVATMAKTGERKNEQKTRTTRRQRRKRRKRWSWTAMTTTPWIQRR